MNDADLARIRSSPGLHGAHCTECDYIFDAFTTPAPLADVVMHMKTTRCPKCGKRKHLLLLMPPRYQEMAEERAAGAAHERR